jgi:hypothetical protein
MNERSGACVCQITQTTDHAGKTDDAGKTDVWAYFSCYVH